MRILCTCLPGHGHFNPMLPLALALARHGHEVAFATAEDFCQRVTVAGFDAFAAGMSLPDQMAEARRRYPDQDRLFGKDRFENFVPRMLAGVAAPARVTGVAEAVETWRPDLVVHDETEFSAAIAATRAGVAYADHSVGILRPLSMLRLAGETLAPLAAEWDVDVGPYGGLFQHLYLDVAPPSLQSPEIDQIPVAHQMQNALMDAGGEGQTLPAWVTELPDRPTVYVSLGTVVASDQARCVFDAVLEGLRDEPVNVILTIGNANDPAIFGPQPEHVRIERFIPQSLLLPYCDVVVNQGGTAILAILAHGLPLLILPQAANQFHNAEACVNAGVGRALLPAEVRAEAVNREVRLLLDDPGLRQAARAIRKEIENMPGPDDAVPLLERLAREGRG